jgi:predicted chitinase
VFEKILNLPPVDRTTQLTIFHCGPASAENILLSMGIDADEFDLARDCRTHEGGTDWIGQIKDVLQARAHHIEWRLQELPRDPATPEDKRQLWDNVYNSIVYAEAPCVFNFVAPVGNYPKASRPSPVDGQVRNPNYGGGTVYHYVTCYGVCEEDNGSRHFLIVDSGFQPAVYWVNFDGNGGAATLIPPKGIVYGYAERPAGVPTLPGPAAAMEEVKALSFAMGDALPIERYEALLPAVKEALRQSDCFTPERVAHWFSQIGHESGGLKFMRELSDGQYLEGRTDLGNVHQGDGPRYRGAGPIQVTGRSNFRQVSEWAHARNLVPTPDYFEQNPDELASDTFAMLGACWYWTVARGSQINDAADRGEGGIEQITRLVNGGTHGLDDRIQRYHKAIQVAAQFVPSRDPVAQHVPDPQPDRASTPLTGRPRHHAEAEDLEGQILSLRAEGLLTQAMVFAIAESVGVNARELYDHVRAGF